MKCFRRLLNISYKDYVTNEEVRRNIQVAIVEYDELLTMVNKRKLKWFGHLFWFSKDDPTRRIWTKEKER